MCKYKVNKSVYSKEAVVIAVQRYLEYYYVSISENNEEYIVGLRHKGDKKLQLGFEEFQNELINAAFLDQKIQQTQALRTFINNKLCDITNEKKATF